MQNIPPVTRALLIANLIVYLLQQIAGGYMEAHFALWPLGTPQVFELGGGSTIEVGFEPWQLVTYAFLHGGSLMRGNIGHIAFNMLALWMFGGRVESVLRSNRFAIYYFVCVIGAAVAQLAVIHFFKPEDFYPTIGASGGVFGVLIAFAVMFPREKIYLYAIVPIPAAMMVVGYLVVEGYFGISGRQEGVAHFAHLGGALAGFVLLQVWRARALRGRER